MSRVSGESMCWQRVLWVGLGLVVLCGEAVADEYSFVMPQKLPRHGTKDFPDLVPLDKALTAPGTVSFSQPAGAPWNPVWDVANRSAAPIAVTGQTGLAGNAVTATQLQYKEADALVRAALRYEQQHTYEAADGQSINTGLHRDSEYLLVQHGNDAGPKLRLSALRDAFTEAKVPYYDLDAPSLERQLFTLSATSLPMEGYFDRLDLKITRYQMQLEADNETLRTPIAQRIAVQGEAGSWQGSARLSRQEGPWLTWESSLDQYDSTRYGHEYGPNRITAIRMPDAQALKAAVEVGNQWRQQNLKITGGVRLDWQHSDLGRADERPNAPGVAAAVYNFSPRALYQRYYGTTELRAAHLEPGASLRMEAQAATTEPKWSLDLRRVVRMPDLVELYMANSGVAELVQVGNPQLKAEKHHRVEWGAQLAAAGFTTYGRGGTTGTAEIRYSSFADYIEDFIALERARGQAGILKSDDGFVQRNVRATLVGIQAEVRGNLLPGLSTRLHVVAQSGRNVTEKTPLYQVPPLEGNLYVDTYGAEIPWHAGLRLRLSNARDAVDTINHGRHGPDWGGAMAGFATLNLYGGYRLTEQLALSGGVANLFDHAYQEPFVEAPQTPTTRTLSAPGRTLYVQLLATY
ncbi:MAG: TonB-dependent receptor [Magnetococcales bacterium]|nr:TonB-dependent receptor [Magnetococcales bacterium]MBF0115040.1 TonB-dependent receptor [Magnetococcales bacterium]